MRFFFRYKSVCHPTIESRQDWSFGCSHKDRWWERLNSAQIVWHQFRALTYSRFASNAVRA